MLNPNQLKSDFPILDKTVNGHSLVYLDNAATAQKPQAVIDAINTYYSEHNANVGRGVYQLANESTKVYHQARKTIAQFFGASEEELVLTRNTTEGINGVAYGWADHNLEKDDVILISLMEHHANLVVWQQAAKRSQAKLEYIQLTDDGRLNLDDLEQKLQDLPVKLVALTHVSNTLGSLTPVKQVVDLVNQHTSQVRVLIDGAQSAPHLPIDFHQLDIDFFAFSGHKMLGPMGVGGLLVRKQLLNSEEMRPWLFGGGMISAVQQQKTEFHSDLQERFIAGTPDVASAIGLAEACRYLDSLTMEAVLEHDQELVQYALNKISKLKKIELVGPTKDRVGSVAFMHQQIHPHDVAQVLDNEAVAVRSGHHCCMPLHQHYDWPATIRASFSVYNTKNDLDRLIKALKKVEQIIL